MEKNTDVSTKYISHFTKDFNTLIKILETGFKPSCCDEYKIWEDEVSIIKAINKWHKTFFGKSIKTNKNIIHKVPMVCFCDLPHSIVSEHIKRYGDYCIAMTKEWAIRNGVSPIFYIPNNTKVHSVLYNIFKFSSQAKTNNDSVHFEKLYSEFIKLFSFIKPYQKLKGNYKYYDEREWRYVPPTYYIKQNVDNTECIYSHLSFETDDLCFIVVKTYAEKELLLNQLEEINMKVDSNKIHIKKTIANDNICNNSHI